MKWYWHCNPFLCTLTIHYSIISHYVKKQFIENKFLEKVITVLHYNEVNLSSNHIFFFKTNLLFVLYITLFHLLIKSIIRASWIASRVIKIFAERYWNHTSVFSHRTKNHLLTLFSNNSDHNCNSKNHQLFMSCSKCIIYTCIVIKPDKYVYLPFLSLEEIEKHCVEFQKK